MFLIKHHGISPLPDRGERTNPETYALQRQRESVSYYDLHLRQMIGYGLLLVALAALLALAFPATLGPQVVPGQEVTKPAWLFWWQYALENFWGLRALLWATVAIPAGLLLVPFIDRTPYRHILNRRLMLALAVVVVLAWVGLTVYVAFTPVAQHLEMGA